MSQILTGKVFLPKLTYHFAKAGAPQHPLPLLVDSTGIKVEGEGEGNARKHGGSKRRVWRKIHIGWRRVRKQSGGLFSRRP